MPPNKGTYRDKLTIYVPPSKRDVVEKVIKMLEAEGSSISKLLVEKIEQHWNEHNPGNSQMSMLIYTGQAKRADPFGCGMVKAISNNSRWVSCLLSKRKESRSYCEHCIRKRV